MSECGHRVMDEWRDCVLVCTCGWRTAEKSKTEARRVWIGHVHAAAAVPAGDVHGQHEEAKNDD